MVRAMSAQPPKDGAPEDRPIEAEKKPRAKVKTQDRETRLADALRANLRRRKSPPAQTSEDE